MENWKDRHIKPTNPQLYLHHSSNHPPQVFKAIVYGQAVTVKTICSKEEYVTKHLDNLKEKCLATGYPIQLIIENLARGAALDREDLVKPNFYPTQATPVLPSKPKFIPTFTSFTIQTRIHSNIHHNLQPSQPTSKSLAEGHFHDIAIRYKIKEDI